MGTTELPTAEITFDGSITYPVGPLEKGLANVVGIVLVYSIMTVGLSSSAFMVRSSREARTYAKFRKAFGKNIIEFPLVSRQLEEIGYLAKSSLAGSLKLYKLFLELPDGFQGGLSYEGESKELWKKGLL